MTSALSPANAPIVQGSTAMMLFLHQRGYSLEHGILLMSLIARESHTLTDEEIRDLFINGDDEAFGLPKRKFKDSTTSLTRAHELMAGLARKGAVVHHTEQGDVVEWITLTESGAVDILAMLGSCMLSGAEPSDRT